MSEKKPITTEDVTATIFNPALPLIRAYAAAAEANVTVSIVPGLYAALYNAECTKLCAAAYGLTEKHIAAVQSLAKSMAEASLAHLLETSLSALGGGKGVPDAGSN